MRKKGQKVQESVWIFTDLSCFLGKRAEKIVFLWQFSRFFLRATTVMADPVIL
jgi:hypothetical protein